jgi:prepilin-type N-terminal cleavage/methylation domain-containing protein
VRNGFTLIEALVALVIFALGMLAVVATSAATARDLGIAHRRAHALTLARDRVGSLHAVACAAPEAGSALGAGGFLEIWRVEVDGRRRIVVDSVAFAVARGRMTSVVVRAAAICS